MRADAQTLDSLVIQVRADTAGFMAGVGDVQRQLDGPLTGSVDRAGASIERALSKAAVTGKLGFEDLGRVALGVLSDIAASALRSDFSNLFGGSGGLIGSLSGAVASLFGLPGRATGGAVSPQRPYLVGERGPELFVPGAAGSIAPLGAGRGAVNVTVNVAMPPDATPAVMQRTGAQVARALRQALAGAQP
jgi:phage-related minor tail protein